MLPSHPELWSPTGLSWVPCSTLYTHDCVSSHSFTSIIKFADDTVVLGLISNKNETLYLDEVERVTSWCQDNCLSLNVSKTKELIVDFRKRQQRPYTPLMISGTPVERVSSFKYLGVNISEDLTWTTHIQTQVKKARQRLYHLWQLIIKDSNHPGNCLFILLPSDKRFRSMMAKSERLRRSFFPQAIRLLNSNSVS